jgi:hypothetical protein
MAEAENGVQWTKPISFPSKHSAIILSIETNSEKIMVFSVPWESSLMEFKMARICDIFVEIWVIGASNLRLLQSVQNSLVPKSLGMMVREEKAKAK